VFLQAGIFSDSGFFSPKKWLLDINSEKPYRSLSYGALCSSRNLRLVCKGISETEHLKIGYGENSALSLLGAADL
jgi:hypothetical protein